MRGPIALLAVLFASAPAGAQTAFDVHADPACASAGDRIARRVVDLRGDRPTAGAGVSVEITRGVDGRWHLLVTEPDAPPRSITGESCEAVIEAAAIILALAPEEPAAPPLPSPARRNDAPPPVPAQPALDPPDPGTCSVTLSAHAGAVFGLLPGVAFLSGAAVAFAGGALEIGALGVAPTTADVPNADGTVRLGLVAASVRGCFAITRGVAACGGLDGGALIATGSGLARNETAAAPWLALRADARAAIPAGPIRVALVASAIAPLSRPRFVVAEAGTAHRPGAVGAEATARVELDFP